jgi:hypothetical protein
MAEENELSKLKRMLKDQKEQELQTNQLAEAVTLDSKQVEVYKVGPRAPASTILGLVTARGRRTQTLGDGDGSDPIVIFDTGPNDPIIIVVPK